MQKSKETNQLVEFESKLEILENQVEQAKEDIVRLKELKLEIEKKYKYIFGKEKHAQNVQSDEITEIRKLLKQIKKLRKYCEERIRETQMTTFDTSKNTLKKEKNEKNLEITRITDLFLDPNISNEEKEQTLSEIQISYIKKQEKLKRKKRELRSERNKIVTNYIRTLKKMTKEEKEAYKIQTQPEFRRNEQAILQYQEEIVAAKMIETLCNSLLSKLRNSNLKIEYPKNKKEKRKEEKNNDYYFNILCALLNDDKNYMFIKEILLHNKKFCTARNEKEHIVFRIVDQYIYNLKMQLLNQKMPYINPNYYYLLLQLYFQNDMQLEEEEICFLNQRLEEIKSYVNTKKYKEAENINANIDMLLQKENFVPKEKEKIAINSYRHFLQEQIKYAILDNRRIHLEKEYLQSLSDKITIFTESYYQECGEYPSEEQLKEILQISTVDLRNSKLIGDTIALKDTKYAFSIGYDKEYNLYFKVHVFDTSFIQEGDVWYQDMQQNIGNLSYRKNKELKFRENNSYPTMTYQFKILKNKEVSSFKMYPSVIHIDKVVERYDLKHYREDESLKNIISCIKCLEQNYCLEEESLTLPDIERMIDSILNIELLEYFTTHHLPSLFYTEIGLSEEEKTKIHNSICYFLGKIPKEEAHEIFYLLKNAKVNRFYSIESLEESKIELDTKTFIGYSNLIIMKAFQNGYWNESIEEKYKEILQKSASSINKELQYIDYFTQQKLERGKKNGKY